MDPHAKTVLDPKNASASTMVAQGPGYVSTLVRDKDDAVADAGTDLGTDDDFGTRYDVRDSLGEGGMGEVRVCRDARIGREVALKVIRKGVGSRSDIHKRFLREARVQGQLEHPAIVPVYDLGRDPAGTTFFTMKRVRGQTLEDVLEKLRDGDVHASEDYTTRKLLTAFVSVCQAVHFAHSRGVLHRDLKPANVMLGDFGEVYVLDWGLARLYTTPEDLQHPHVQIADDATGKTAHGAIMGTPGYMSPEQIRGAIDELDERSDVYALGTMLFEILTREPLHLGDTADRILVETLRGADARPSVRAPLLEVAPELETICVRATALDKPGRYPSARALSDAVEDYLDGDRDLARRKVIAKVHAANATIEAERALAGHGDPDARAKALQEVGRAIVLDPQNLDAAKTLLQLLTEPPRELPPEARAEATASEQRVMRGAFRAAAWAYGSFILYLPFSLWMGIRSKSVTWGTDLIWVSVVLLCSWAYRRKAFDERMMFVFYGMTLVAVATTSVFFGSLVFLPMIAVGNTLAIMLGAPRRHRAIILAVGVSSIVIPFALERLGVLPNPYEITGDAVIIHAFRVHYPPTATFTLMLFGSIACLFTGALFVARMRDAHRRAEERIILQAWQLRQLVPTAAHGAMGSAPPRAPDPSSMLQP